MKNDEESMRSDFAAWRDRKLAAWAEVSRDPIVEVGDIKAPTAAEEGELRRRCRLANLAVYSCRKPVGKGDLLAFAARFGLKDLDANALADDDGVTPLAVAADGARSRYIPYTDRPIAWHTDGYYNESVDQVRGLVLHCARPAARGGANTVMDHEIAWLLLRDENPAHVEALARPDAMTIPPNDDEGLTRGARGGPVFSFPGGALHMRYTARKRNVAWSDDPGVRAAVACLERLLAADGPHQIRHRLEAGQGLLCNNVLHDRQPFEDEAGAPRLLWRARFRDRIEST
ncbi:MAG: TauD/TfdA family dioxygenase [Alphaproteobacteria bacterium]|nr:TauD/TfdA family dioxygenase [Alphaproteobacteria bacterium]